MPKDDAALKAQGEEIEAILQEGKKKELNFVLMKSKAGVVLKAGPAVKGFPKLKAECKADGGMPAFSACGMMTVSGRTMNMTAVEEEPVDPAVLRKLAGQAKKHFKAMGIRPAKMIMTLPNGEVIDSDSVPEDEGEGEDPAPQNLPGVGDEVPVSVAPVDDPDARLKAQLTERLKALVPQVKEAVARAVQGADKLAAALKAAGGEIAGGALDRAGKLLDAVEATLKKAGGNDAPPVDEAGLKEQLSGEFKALSGDLRKVLEEGEKAVAGKAAQFAQMFRKELEGDLKKAAAVLSALKRFVGTEVAKLAPPDPKDPPEKPEEGLFDDIVDGLGNVVSGIGSTVSDTVGRIVETVQDVGTKVVEGVTDVFNDLTGSPEERSARGLADALGYSREEREKLIETMKTDPKAAETLAKGRMKDAGVPDGRQAELLAMAMHDPKAFVAALGSLARMDKDGAIDISDDAMRKSFEALEKARQEDGTKQKEAAEALARLNEQMKLYGAAGKAVTDARGKLDEANRAIEELKNRIGDPKALSDEEKLKFAEESRKLINACETAKAELARAIEAEKQASMDYADASDRNGKAQEAAEKSREKLDAAQAVQDAKDGKKALIDAMAFGPLSPAGKLSDEDKAKFAAAYGKNPKVADGMLAMAGTARNPKALADNAAFLADTAAGGFAGPDGRKLDLPKDQLDRMALNAARMGDEAGGDYFRNFDAYLKSGKQLEPDPTGGLDGPLSDPKEEAKRRNAVAMARTRALGSAAVKGDGTVDFSSDAARGQMDHMMFHPGSLKTFTPQMNMKMAETRALFENPATRDRANQTIKDTTLPGPTAPGRNAALTLVAGTTGKPKDGLTDNDARASVLGAMMTPLSQGPVGSCFSTAPVRALRETNPLRAMDEYAKIARTGQYTSASGNIYPANTHLPEGENPLMRSFEYSVATAGADVNNSNEKNALARGLFRDGDAANNLRGIKGIGNAKWNNKVDPLTGDVIPGVGQKLLNAVRSELTFEYNAGPQVGGPSGGGGDGHSTDGAYEIMYKGKALTSQAAFIEAIKAIALGAAGETAGTVTGDAIIDHVTKQAFVDSILGSNTGGDYKPWKLDGGGFSRQTTEALYGGTAVYNDFLAETPEPPPPKPGEGARTKTMLTNVLAQANGSPDKMKLFKTNGENANHAFSVLPNDPSMALVAPPDSAGKIDTVLAQPGREIAARKLPAEQVKRLFDAQVRAQLEGKPDADRTLILKALKSAPTTEMTPDELGDKVASALSEYRDAVAQRRLDAWFPARNKVLKDKGQPEMPPGTKQDYLAWFKTDTGKNLKGAMRDMLMKELAPPQVTFADTNWGGPESQTFFVVAPDVMTGELVMWEKTMPEGTMRPAGRQWADAKWSTID